MADATEILAKVIVQMCLARRRARRRGDIKRVADYDRAIRELRGEIARRVPAGALEALTP